MDEYELAAYWQKLWKESNGHDITAPAREVCMTIDALMQLSAMLDAERAENSKLREGRMLDQTAKADAGKPAISNSPPQIIWDIAEVKEYGDKKYGDPNNWKSVDIKRYIDALLRHTLAFWENPDSVDTESGIAHYKHMACNMAFICEMMRWRHEKRGE